jgi:hypothetical protein
MEEDKENIDRLCFIRQGDNGMSIEIVGSPDILMSMIHSGIMSHYELRRLLIPVMMKVMKDDEFMELAMKDMLSKLSGENSDDIVDTE